MPNETTEKGWREIWVSAGRSDQKRSMVLFKNENGEVVWSEKFIGDIEILTSVPDAAHVQITVIPASWKE
jgi:hypothetical protein